ncbi:TIGR02679 family protein [Kribbella sp. NPDC055071]
MSTRGSYSSRLLPVWQEVHRRLSSGLTVCRVRVGPLSDAEREALADLLGLDRLPGSYATVSLNTLERAVGGSIHSVVTDLLGPLGNRAEDIRHDKAVKAQLWSWLRAHPVVQAQPALQPWVTAVENTGVFSSVDKTRSELAKVLKVIRELPATGAPLPVFADAVLGDPHALDEGTRRATLVLKAMASIFDVPLPTDAITRRTLWAQAGVSDDELSSTVLVAGFRPAGASLVATVLRACADAGDAASLTLRQLRRSRLRTGVTEAVWVFENPSILALAVERFGRTCPPLICTSGWPSSAGILFLEQLRDAGTVVYYHGDFDGEGLRIAASVVARIGATPWLLTTADYIHAAGGAGPPVGRVTPVPWDADLGAELIRRGTSVPEERVAEALLDTLAVQTVGSLP